MLTVLAVWFVISLTVLPVALLLMRSGKRADADVREQRDALLDGAPAVAAAPRREQLPATARRAALSAQARERTRNRRRRAAA